MLNINGMKIKIKKSYFNKTKVKDDGVTHVVDTSVDYPMFNLDICKSYFDIDDKDVVINYVISDLKLLIAELEEIKNKDNDRELD